MYNFYAFISRLKHIKRWGLMRNTEIENVKEHSFDCAVIAHALALIKNKFYGGNVDAQLVMSTAVFHEAGEIITGDIATPIKYFNPDIINAYKNIENIAIDKIMDMLPEELKPDYTGLLRCEDEEVHSIVKAADKLCAYIKCIEEMKLGNMEFEKASVKIKAELDASTMPEVKYFIENILPGYSLTIDELN